MKLKNKFSALTVALAMGAVALVGCGDKPQPQPEPPAPVYYTVSVVSEGHYTVSAFEERGYLEGATVSFTVTPETDWEITSVTANRGLGTLTPSAGTYSFKMPDGNVSINIFERAIERYVLAHTGTIQVDGDPVEFSLTLGSDVQPSAAWTLSATSGAEHVSIDQTSKKVTAISATEEGEVVEFAAKVGGEVVGTDSAEVLPSLRSSIADAITDAWGDGTTAFANNNKKGSEAKSTKEYIITGKVMAFGNLNEGTQEAIIDDGTGLLDLQCLSVTASKPCPFALGDVVEVKNYLQNHYGLLEISCFPDTVKVVDQAITPKSTFPTISAEEYVSALDDLSSTTEPRLIVDCSLVADGAPSGTSKRFNVEGVTSYNNGKMAASRGISGQELLCEEGVPYEFSGYLLNFNTNGNYSNLFPVTQELKAAESVAISNKAEVESMAINNEVQLTYTTVPAHTGKVVSWASSDDEVVTVVDGLVSAVGGGTATVTLTVDGHSDTVEIVVSEAITPVTSASFSEASKQVTKESTFDLKTLLTVGPEGANEKGTWSVEEGKDAIVSVADGVVTAIAKGTANVSVHYATNNVTATIAVEVIAEHGKDASDPLTVAEALAKGAALPGIDRGDVYTEEEWYMGAVVEEITSPYSSQYENFSFKCDGFSFERVSVTSTVAVKGAYVVVKGYIHNYSRGYKINVQKKGDSAPAVVESDIAKPHLVEISGPATVNKNESVTLTAAVFPEALHLAVDSWDAGDDKVTVTDAGVVTGVKAGSSSVIASVGTDADKVSATFEISVAVPGREYVLAKQGLFGTGKTESGMTGNGNYTSKYEHTNSGFTVVTQNVNFGGSSYWDIGRFGRNGNASTADVYTKAAVSEAIGKISINFTQASNPELVTIKVYTSTNGTNWTEVDSLVYAAGEQSLEFDTPTANLFYKVSFICQAGTANGFGRFNQFNLYTVK